MSLCRQNYLDTRDYLEYQQHYRHCSSGTIAKYKNYIQRLIEWADSIPFSQSHKIKTTFPEYLDKLAQLKRTYSQHYLEECCRLARDFFHFSKDQYGSRYKEIKPTWIRLIVAQKQPSATVVTKYYSFEDLLRLCSVQPETLSMRRVRAAAAFLFLSGMRVRAFLTLPIECVNLDTLRIFQDPSRGVYTKMNKAAITSLFGIPELLEVVRDWDSFVRANCPLSTTWYAKLYSNYGLSPKRPPSGTRDESYIHAVGSYKQLCTDLHTLCDLADVDYKSPHAFRYGHTHFGLSHSKTMAEMKAVSLNLMHASLSITDEIYSRMDSDQINAVISSMGAKDGLVRT